VLLEGAPGVAKTLLVRTLAEALGGRFGRVQFTPDLMPADVTGTSVFQPDEATFRFAPLESPLGETVLAAAQATGATVMIPGNVYNYGTGVSVDMDETMTARPDTEKGRIRVQLEALFADAAAARGVRTIVIRAGDFFGGTADGSWLDLMIEAHTPPLTSLGSRLRLRYMTQVKSRPPSFVLFASKPDAVPEDYRRFLVNGLRRDFDLPGTPVRLFVRAGDNPYRDRRPARSTALDKHRPRRSPG